MSGFEQAGEMHNQSLGHVLNEIDKLGEDAREPDDLYQTAERSTRSFMDNRGIETQSFDGVKLGAEIGRSVPSSTSPPEIGSLLPDSLHNALTAEQKYHIDQALDIVTADRSVKPTVSQLQTQFASINSAAQEELSQDEAEAVLYTTSVAESSMLYWSEHVDKWAKVVHPERPETQTGDFTFLAQASPEPMPSGFWGNVWKSVKKIAVADAAGAAGGAAGAAIAGEDIGTGALVGGASSSASAAVKEIL